MKINRQHELVSVDNTEAWGSIVLPNTIKSIGNKAFKGNPPLQSIIIPDSVTNIGNNAFNECRYLERVIMSNSVTSIGKCAFGSCNNLKKIVISNNVTEIKLGTFGCCHELKELNLPSHLISIEPRAFIECTNLEEMVIPDTVTRIGVLAFACCTKLKKVNIPRGVEIIEDGTFEKCKSLKTIIIPSSVITIGEKAFCNCISLNKITLPSSVKNIDNNAFSGCINLATVDISKNVKNIGDSAFEYCSSLTEITIPSRVTNIGDYAFYHCDSLRKVVILNGVKNIGSSAFKDCKNLTKISIPDSVKKIGSNAFENCVNLEEIVLPKGIENIGYFPFDGCKNLKKITIKNSKCDTVGIDASLCFKLKWIYINKDGSIEICKDRKETIDGYSIEIVFDTEEKEKIFNTNYRLNYINAHKWKKEGKIKFIPPEYTLLTFPSEQLENYFLNNNNHRWGKLVKELGLTTLENEEKYNSLTDLMKIYYSIGGFSPNQGECEKAYDYIKEYIKKYFKHSTPTEIGEDIHRRFTYIELSGEYNKDFATFFMKYFNDNPDFMNARELYKNSKNHNRYYEQDYLCSACNLFSDIQKLYPNRVVNGNEERSLLTPLFVAEHCSIKKYENVENGNEKLANLLGKYGYSQENFEHIQEIYNEAKKIKTSCVIKANRDNEENNATFRLLEKDDPLGFVLGDITNCCQHIGGQASSCVEDGYLNPNAGFMVFEETETKRILAQAYVWYDEKTKTICYDNIEIPTNILDELKKYSSKIKTKDLLNAIEKSAESIMNAMNKDGEIRVERVTTGAGYNDLKNELSKKYEREVTPIARRGDGIYSDAKKVQYILKTYEGSTKNYSNSIKAKIEETKKIANEICRKIKKSIVR